MRDTSPLSNKLRVAKSIHPLLVSSVVSTSRNLTMAMDAASVLWLEARLRISLTMRRDTCWQKATTSQNFSLMSFDGQLLKTCKNGELVAYSSIPTDSLTLQKRGSIS